jgi:protease-4
MSLETDLLLDRRRLKRRLLLWRVVAVLAVLGCALLAIGHIRMSDLGGHVARLNISGIITNDRRLTEAVRAAGTDRAVKAMIVRIDSPGGSVAGGESLHAAIAEVAASKPVVVVMDGTAASAGYMIAVPAARIFARGSTITGSIGVILETGEASGLLGKLGLTAEAITSGPLKDQPSFTRPLTPQGRDVLHGLVMDMYDQFVTMVAQGRHMTADQVRALADGRAYSGRQALALGLVDAIGGEPEARQWLAEAKGVPASLPVRDIATGGWAERAFLGDPGGVFGLLMKSVLNQGLRLDGALALWQPSLSDN